MANPALIAMIAEMAAKTAEGFGELTPTELERREKDRVAALERQMEEGALGLSEREREQIFGEAALQQQATQDALRRQREAQLGSALGIGSGEALKAAVASEEQSRKLAEQRTASVQGADIARAREQEDEYWARLANQAERKRAKVQAVLGGGSRAAKTVGAVAAQKQTMEGAAPSAAQMKEFAGEFGLGDEEAAALFNELLENPEVLRALQQLG